jgi:NAD(P)-dependent dehydrogenase (short-subunit alcohol dehydrogenase family)
MALAAEGAAVAVVARTKTVWDSRMPGTIYETVQAIIAAGGRAVAISADLSNEEDVARVVEETRAQLGTVDILVNNAAITIGGRPPAPGEAPRESTTVRIERAPAFVSFPLKAYRLHFAVNVFAAFRLMQLVLPGMYAAGRGAIINISSTAAFRPGEGPYENAGSSTLVAYGSTKAALHNLTQAVAIESADKGVTANVLLPSRPIKTPGSSSLLQGQVVTEWSTPESFAQAVVELALVSPAERTGQILFHEDVLHPELGRRGRLTST